MHTGMPRATDCPRQIRNVMGQGRNAERMLYEIRIYTAAPNRADPLRERFRDHTLRLFARHGIEVVGCWVPPEQPDQLVYMTRFPDEPARQAAWDGLDRKSVGQGKRVA